MFENIYISLRQCWSILYCRLLSLHTKLTVEKIGCRVVWPRSYISQSLSLLSLGLCVYSLFDASSSTTSSTIFMGMAGRLFAASMCRRLLRMCMCAPSKNKQDASHKHYWLPDWMLFVIVLICDAYLVLMRVCFNTRLVCLIPFVIDSVLLNFVSFLFRRCLGAQCDCYVSMSNCLKKRAIAQPVQAKVHQTLPIVNF